MIADAFLGADSGLQATGLVVVEVDHDKLRVIAMRCIQTEPHHRKHNIYQIDDDTRRCVEIARGVRELYRSNPFRGAVVELPAGGARGSRANRAMGLAHGVIVGALQGLDVPVECVMPEDVKVFAGGKRHATKEQVQRGVLKALDWSEVESNYGFKRPANRWEHIADAAGALLARRGWAQSPFRALDAPNGGSTA